MKIFLCYTPLHALIARRIIESKKLTEVVGIYLTFNNTDKHMFYAKKLESMCSTFLYLHLKKGSIIDLLSLWRLGRQLRKKAECTREFYCANIKQLYARILLGAIEATDYYTFDDGSGNISGAGYFYNRKDRWFKSILFSFLDKRLLYHKIVENIRCHFTIYDFPNVFSPQEKIELFEDIPHVSPTPHKRMSIYLANAFFEDGLMSRDAEKDLDRHISEHYRIDRVILHPRSKKTENFANVQIVDTPLIAEEYVLSLLSDYRITVYGCYSSALIYLSTVPGVEVVNIRCDVAKPVNGLNEIFDMAGIKNESY